MLTRRELMAVGTVTLAMQAVPGGATGGGDNATALADAAAGCMRAGDACLQHCLDLLAKGDTSIADCAKSVTQMLGVCRGVGPLADARSKHLPAMARLCEAVCTDCAGECRKHAERHPICKTCLEACEKSAAAAKVLAA
ncbi:MAG TPA: Csp1 family four helix bundle copper storage protein [Candidatus Eisenbacteria bacterium]|nr:Csp1 family four helix bundle copper storage protein [Candidatus Eisenbacteria bacterium]